MTDYSKMSDYEINKAVGLATGEATASEPVFSQVMRNSTGRVFNPCNSWADAGPIIEHNGISLVRSGTGMWWADGNAYWVDGVEWQIDGEGDNNPLRAAMIVFLMMKDAENDNPS